MKINGLTGTIASGKSSVSKILQTHGGFIIDADKINHENMKSGGSAYDEIVDAFGLEVLVDGEIDRKKLGKIVFADKNKLDKLVGLTHKHVISKTNELLGLAEKAGADFSVIDAPLLIEAGIHEICDEVWLVSCSRETAIKRLFDRDGLLPDEALERLGSRKPFEELKRFATHIIENDGTMDDLRAVVEKII